MTTKTDEQERAAFEAWANGRCELHLVNPAGRYSSAITQFAWEAYQAGRAALQAEVERLRELSDEAFATIVAALSLAPQDCGAHGVLDDAIKNLQPKLIRSAMEPCDPDTIRGAA